MPEINGIGDRIREGRSAKGLSQADLGRMVGVPSTHVSKWERGENTPRGSAIRKIADALGLTLEWLQAGRGIQSAPGLVRIPWFTVAWECTDMVIKLLDREFSEEERFALVGRVAERAILAKRDATTEDVVIELAKILEKQ